MPLLKLWAWMPFWRQRPKGPLITGHWQAGTSQWEKDSQGLVRNLIWKGCGDWKTIETKENHHRCTHDVPICVPPPLISTGSIFLFLKMKIKQDEITKKVKFCWFFEVAKNGPKYVFWLGFCTGKYALLRENTALCTGVRFGTYLVRT